MGGCDQNVDWTWKSFPIDILEHVIGREIQIFQKWGNGGAGSFPHPPPPILGDCLIEKRRPEYILSCALK